MPSYRIKQSNLTVAAVEGDDPEAEASIMHYARQLREDGELTIQIKHMLPGGPSWKRHILMAQYPQPTIND